MRLENYAAGDAPEGFEGRDQPWNTEQNPGGIPI